MNLSHLHNCQLAVELQLDMIGGLGQSSTVRSLHEKSGGFFVCLESDNRICCWCFFTEKEHSLQKSDKFFFTWAKNR